MQRWLKSYWQLRCDERLFDWHKRRKLGEKLELLRERPESWMRK